ncbi:MAG TPA: hypothetical protein VER03_14340 [Bryobacteraceae bacterium]|nr:hypothetical protein [Bryobacteraceae bacterium]
MLVIRQAQYAALEQATLERWLEKHLDDHFPELRESYPDDRHRQFIRDGMARARTRGFTEGPHVAQWLNLMTVLGPRFDDDAAHSWVADILNSSEPASHRIQDLLSAAEKHLWADAEESAETT